MDALRATWPGLRIVGEEDEHDATDATHVATHDNALRRDLIRADTPDASEWKEPMDVLTVFVDPVDGTREFVEGRLGAVQCLIGVACRGRAVAGAVGLPFPDGSLEHETSVVWGAARPGRAAGESGVAPRGAAAAAERRTRTERRRRRAGVRQERLGEREPRGRAARGGLRTCRRRRREQDPRRRGGPRGNRSCTGLALGHVRAGSRAARAREGDRSVRRAPDARPRAPRRADQRPRRAGDGARGSGLKKDARGRDHAAMPRRCARTDARGTPGAVLRAERLRRRRLRRASQRRGAVLDGSPLRVSEVGRAITSTLCGGDEPGTLLRYSAPESTAIRGLMSDAVRLELAWGEPSAAGMPSTAFYKRVKLGDLEYARTKAATQPMKIARDVKSAGVEAAFLACAEVTSALAAANVRVPRCFGAELRPDAADPIESAFALVLEDFAPNNGWHQERLLDPAQARATLSALARMHATFTAAASAARGDRAHSASLERAVWPAGAYWQPDMQPASQMTTVASTWRDTHLPAFREAFQACLPADVDVATLGERLQAVARDVGAASHPFGLDAPSGAETRGKFEKWRTLIHGDAKAANVFLRASPDAPEGVEVGLIDFQWMGFGLGVVDAAHVIAASVDPKTLGFADGDAAGSGLSTEGVGGFDENAVPALFAHYYDAFIGASVANGAAGSLEEARRTWPFEEASAQYDAALLDFSRVVFGYQWVRVGASPASLAAAADSYNKNSYNKSLPNAMWLVRECDAALRRRRAA